MADTKYVPQYYKSADIQYLPIDVEVEGANSLTVDFIKKSEVEETWRFVEECAETGFNVGTDEYTKEEYQENQVKYSTIFLVRDKVTGESQGVLLLRPSAEGRSVSPCSVKPLLFLSRDCQTMYHYRSMMSLACRLAGDLQLRYNGCILPVFACCHDMLVTLRRLRFSIVATLPWNGKVKSKGLQDCHLLYKDIVDEDIECWPWESLINHVNVNMLDEQELCLDDITFPQISYLPVQYTLRAGVDIILRNMHKDECEKVYNLLRTAATGGKGYAIDEYPNLQVFIEWLLMHIHTVILEDANTKETLALFTVGTQALSRTKEPINCDTNILVLPGHGGKGIGREMCDIYTGLCKDLGYKGSLSDTFFFNSAALAIADRLGYHIVGSIPKNSYVSGRGWTDTMIIFRELGSYKSFKEMKKEQDALKANGDSLAIPPKI